ncbi:MAG: gliding motility lipoprotein GldH [Chitinophagaceae bacterium]
MPKKFVNIVSLLCCSFLFSCRYKVGYYEKNVVVPYHAWSSSFRPNFTFEITDTANAYNIYILVRHTDAYHYNNIWINFTSIAPASIAETQRLNLRLGDNSKWLGSQMDDIVEHRILVNRNPVKLKAGKYVFMLQTIMREDPLDQVMNLGVRVAKVE